MPATDPLQPLRLEAEAARAAGDSEAELRALIALGQALSAQGREREIVPALERVEAQAARVGDDRLGRDSAQALAELHARTGDPGMEELWRARATQYRDRIAGGLQPLLPMPEAPATSTSTATRPVATASLPMQSNPAPAPRWPWFLIPLSAVLLGAWWHSQRRAEALAVEKEKLARHERNLRSANQALKVQAEQMRLNAVTDPLTRAMTRKAFVQQLQGVLQHAAHYGKPVALIVFDLDHFKAINDSQGHLAGDEALKLVAGIVRENVDSDDLFGRFGGDEFLVGCIDRDRGQALALAETLRLAVAERVGSQPPPFSALSLSLGIAHATPQTGYDLEPLFARADAALYAAKRGGRNRSELEAPEQLADDHAPAMRTLT